MRTRLRQALESEGFTVFAAEWWHFEHHSWKKYPVMNVPFRQISSP
jgi:D-alanyl-D-alanine dipeptidase